MPTTLKISASIGSEMKPAHKRGATMYLSGSTPIISRLESCSVDFMLPISAVSAEPARPANSNAVTTGPSSRSKVKATICPTACSEPYLVRMLKPCRASTIPMKTPETTMIASDSTPTE
ncbi:hypothetical protein D3C77_395680 [compost metagenome]